MLSEILLVDSLMLISNFVVILMPKCLLYVGVYVCKLSPKKHFIWLSESWVKVRKQTWKISDQDTRLVCTYLPIIFRLGVKSSAVCVI